jgi:hypothetical protein
MGRERGRQVLALLSLLEQPRATCILRKTAIDECQHRRQGRQQRSQCRGAARLGEHVPGTKPMSG